MPREFSRTARLAEQIQRELASMLLTEVGDPRLNRLLISGVELSRDMSHARVFVTVPRAPLAPRECVETMAAGGEGTGRSDHGKSPSPPEPALPTLATPATGDPIRALRSAAGYFRRQLAQRLRVRAVPVLQFEHDRTLDSAERIERLLKAAAPASDPDG